MSSWSDPGVGKPSLLTSKSPLLLVPAPPSGDAPPRRTSLQSFSVLQPMGPPPTPLPSAPGLGQINLSRPSLRPTITPLASIPQLPPSILPPSLSGTPPLSPTPPAPLTRVASFRRTLSQGPSVTVSTSAEPAIIATAPSTPLPALQTSWSLHVPKLLLASVTDQQFIAESSRSMIGGNLGSSIDREYQARILGLNPRRSNHGNGSLFLASLESARNPNSDGALFAASLEPVRKPSGVSMSTSALPDRPASRPSTRHSADGIMVPSDWQPMDLGAPGDPAPVLMTRHSVSGLMTVSPESHFARRQLSPLLLAAAGTNICRDSGASYQGDINSNGGSSNASLLSQLVAARQDSGPEVPQLEGRTGPARSSSSSTLLDLALPAPALNPISSHWGNAEGVSFSPTPPPPRDSSSSINSPTFQRPPSLTGLQPTTRTPPLLLEARSPTLPPPAIKRSPSNRFSYIPLSQMQSPVAVFSTATAAAAAAAAGLDTPASDAVLGDSDCGGASSPSSSNSDRSSSSPSPAIVYKSVSFKTFAPTQDMDGHDYSTISSEVQQQVYLSHTTSAEMHTTLTLTAMPDTTRSLGVTKLPPLLGAARIK